MTTNALNQAEFKNTFSGKMIDVTETAIPQFDIWPYVKFLTDEGLVSKYTYENSLVEAVYRNSDNTFDQILLPTSNPNIFVVIVADLLLNRVKGHYKLDLEAEYRIKQNGYSQ